MHLAQLNIAKAKELLAKAGYPNGKGFPTLKFGWYIVLV